MAKKKKDKAKKRGGRRWTKKRKQQYMIVFVSAIFVFSGLYFGFSRDIEQLQQESMSDLYKIVEYDSSRLSDQEVAVRVVEPLNQYKLIPKQIHMIDQRELIEAFESNVSGVTDMVWEAARGYNMFHIYADHENVTDEIRKRIRMRGDYVLYRVYRAESPLGELMVIGEELNVGSYYNVMILKRAREGYSEYIGYVSRKLVEGPVVEARVESLDSLVVEAVSGRDIVEGDISAVFNASEINVKESQDNESGRVWYDVRFSLPLESNRQDVEDGLDILGLENVTVNVQGFSSTVDSMVLGEQLARIPNNQAVPTVYSEDIRVNETVNVTVFFMRIQNQTIAFAYQLLGNDTSR